MTDFYWAPNVRFVWFISDCDNGNTYGSFGASLIWIFLAHPFPNFISISI